MAAIDDLTVLPEHSQRSDEFDPWGVHGDEDHAVLSMSEKTKCGNAGRSLQTGFGCHMLVWLSRDLCFHTHAPNLVSYLPAM